MAPQVPVPDIRQAPGPHVFVDDLETLDLANADHHHLSTVLRLRYGDSLTASDGRGRWRTCTFEVPLVAVGPIHESISPMWSITLCVALTKQAKPELAIQKATELGVDRLVLFAAERSVARWDANKRNKIWPRLERIIREAAMQSRQVALPTVEWCENLAEVVERFDGDQFGLARADFCAEPLAHRLESRNRAVAVGPEGGWTDAERAVLPAAVDLGPTVLRAETAAVVAAARMADLRALN